MPKTFTECNRSRVLQLDCFLQKHQYFSRDSLPGVADAMMFLIFDRQRPERSKYPSLFFWYATIKQFTPKTIESWHITSQEDSSYQSILNSFRKHYELDATTVSGGSDSRSPPSRSVQAHLMDYIMNIKFRSGDRKVMEGLKNSIASKTQITSCECIREEMRVSFKGEELNVEEVKNLVSRSPEVLTSEIKKDKKKRLTRAQTYDKH